jgi:GNAT superfamily N-acetyltransferase
MGVLKTGDKNLFIARGTAQTEMTPRCVLDFYVHESAQRLGIGSTLFDYFLSEENKVPARLAYDRPSDKFLHFLAKKFEVRIARFPNPGTVYCPSLTSLVIKRKYSTSNNCQFTSTSSCYKPIPKTQD